MLCTAQASATPVAQAHRTWSREYSGTAVRLDTAITLPVCVEAYGAYALGAWLTLTPAGPARTFAKRSAIGSLLLGMLGQRSGLKALVWKSRRNCPFQSQPPTPRQGFIGSDG
jgi:hypothetical protein